MLAGYTPPGTAHVASVDLMQWIIIGWGSFIAVGVIYILITERYKERKVNGPVHFIEPAPCGQEGYMVEPIGVAEPAYIRGWFEPFYAGLDAPTSPALRVGGLNNHELRLPRWARDRHAVTARGLCHQGPRPKRRSRVLRGVRDR